MSLNRARWTLRVMGASLGVLLAGCQFSPGDEAIFRCDTEADCGGEGFQCLDVGALGRVCCRPSAEVCDGEDNDCNGQSDDLQASCYSGPAGTQGVGRCAQGAMACQGTGESCVGEVVPQAESCNGLDDNCDGAVDEGFDLSSSLLHCGTCDSPCAANELCQDSTCVERLELSCVNGADDDGDLLVDCADPDCLDVSCGQGCVCSAGARRELSCGDTTDNDGDTRADCLDADCDAAACGQGCTCQLGARTESLCSDGEDNDGDLLIDCAESADCDTRSCGTGCACRSAVKAELVCGDGLDNDGLEGADCLDPDCELQSCGTGCECRATVKVELACGDGLNNDGLEGADCADPDCDLQSCGTGCECRATVKVELACSDGLDNDGDGFGDCRDTDCHTGTCSPAAAGCVMCNGQKHETTCDDFVSDARESNWVDNDGDGLRNCQDVIDCPAGVACFYRQGPNNRAGVCRADRSCGP